MTTFTLRASDELTGRLSSAEMRLWLDDFLRQPHPLPPDPGSGYGRVSLTLSDSAVRAAVGHCQCAISSVLRRIAIERIELEKTSVADVPRRGASARDIEPVSKTEQEKPNAAAEIALALIHVLFLIGLLSLFVLRRRRSKPEGCPDNGEKVSPAHIEAIPATEDQS